MKLSRTKVLFNRLRRQAFYRVELLRVVLLAILGLAIIGLLFLLFPSFKSTTSAFRQFTGSNISDHSGITNFLVLGVGGGSHEGFDLTDSIIFASLNRQKSKLTLISIPRDIWVGSLQAKLNTAYHYGFAKDATSGGLLLVKSAISEVIDQPVDYVFVIDFSVFEKAINLVGGVDVTVSRTFDDYHYPIAGKENDPCDNDPEYKCRYEHLHFSQGPQHLDGSSALKYVRSRYSDDSVEGTDFGRSQRQEKVISAFISKLSSSSIYRHPQIYLDLYKLFSSTIITDVSRSQYFSLAKLALSYRKSKIASTSLTEPDQLYNPPLLPQYGNQWILLPKNSNSQIIYDFVSRELDKP